jgi:hypothetical protein
MPGEDLYLTPSAGHLAGAVLKANGARTCIPPVDDGTMALLMGKDGGRLIRFDSDWLR